MVAVERLKDDALVARVQQGKQRGIEAAGGSGGDKNFAVRIDGEFVEVRKFLRDAFAQGSDAIRAGVDVVTIVNRGDGCFDDRVRRVGVADALRHIDPSGSVAGDGHGADFRLHGVRGEVRKMELRCGKSVHEERRTTKGRAFHRILPKPRSS